MRCDAVDAMGLYRMGWDVMKWKETNGAKQNETTTREGAGRNGTVTKRKKNVIAAHILLKL